MRDDEPLSYFFFEQLGERPVGAGTLIDCGTELWMQAADVFAVVGLWDYARKLIDSAPAEHGFSRAEHLQLSVLRGFIVPPDWKDAASFPFKGLLISAIYFHEAREALAGPTPDRAWHLVSTAHYHLGVNSIESAQMASSRMREQKNSAVTVEIRALVGCALDWVIETKAPVSVTQAKALVIEWLGPEKQGREFTDLLLLYADKSGISKSLPPELRRRDALEKIEGLLDAWAKPTGPYPEITRKFSAACSKTPLPPEEKSTTANLERPTAGNIDSKGISLEIIFVRPDGHRLAIRFRALD